MDAVGDLAGWLGKSRRILVFSGAGISTASGIPDFRGPNGLWTRRKPVYHDEFLASDAKRVEYWDYKADAHEAFRAARPNPAHLAVARLDTLGRLQAVVTQNIDGLHQDGGLAADRVVELHGTSRWVECLSCARRFEPDGVVERFRREHVAPTCACGGWLKSATISFGQALRPEVMERAAVEASRADLVLALGSTLSVYPAAWIPLKAAQAGVPYVIVNQGTTDHDEEATLKLDADVAEVLPKAMEAIEAGR